jgi:poly-gamma-glutamate synthesis protein (capsule biosynthesis protein)
MDRRTFIKTMSQAAAVASVAPWVSRSEAATPWRLTVAAVGDYLPGRRLEVRGDAPFEGMRDLLRGVDCAWANCETVIAEPGTVRPAFKGLDPHVLAAPWAADQLAWLGVDLVGTANNHTVDWGEAGLASTLAELERAGIAHAGAGVDLAQAAQPGYTDTPGGRVGLVNCSVTFRKEFQAGPAHPLLPGRPGLNPLQLDYAVQVEQGLFKGLAPLLDKTLEIAGYGRYREEMMPFLTDEEQAEAWVGEQKVVPGDGFDLLATTRPSDVERITEAVAIARRNARVVIASTHAHEARESLDRSEPAVEAAARATIDAGADLFVAAGPHLLRGIEVYNGKPIFYSLGNFVFHPLPYIPAESYSNLGLPADTLDSSKLWHRIFYRKYPEFWQSIIPVVTVEGNSEAEEGIEATRVTAVELHPISLGFGEPAYHRGTPVLASATEGEEILRRMIELSRPYGTEITIRDGVGHLELG